MPWNPPPCFGGDELSTNDGNAENSIWRTTTTPKKCNVTKKMTMIVEANTDSLAANSNSTRRPHRMGSQRSIAWRPPPSFAAHRNFHPPIIAEEEVVDETDDDDLIKAAAKKVKGMVGVIDTNSNDDVYNGLDLHPSPSDDATIGIHQQCESGVDEGRDDTQRPLVEAFRSFRIDIARCVARNFKISGDGSDRNDVSHNKNTNTANKSSDTAAIEKEILLQTLTTAMEDAESRNCEFGLDFCGMETRQPSSVSEGEYFSFLEGVRMAVCASSQLAMVLFIKQQLCQQHRTLPRVASIIPQSQDDELPPPPPPQRYRSMRAMSIARARKQCDDLISSYGNDSDIDEDNRAKLSAITAGTGTNLRPTKSRRSISISGICRENGSSQNTMGTATTLADPNNGDDQGDAKEIKKLLEELEEAEKYQRRLEQQLKKAGVVIAEDIPYDTAKQKVVDIAKRMSELHSDNHGANEDTLGIEAEYYKLEQEMEKYITALEMTEEWIEEQANDEREWEESVKDQNEVALGMILRHMPVDVRNRSELQLRENPSPNGKFLPRSIAQKFKRTNCLQLLRTDPDEMFKWHPSMFESLRVTGLTLTERRALYHHLKDLRNRWKDQCKGGGNKMTERKLAWFEMLQSNFKESLSAYERHVDSYGPPGNHTNCPMIGRQCPLKADMLFDYAEDYGYPETSVYFIQTNGNDNLLEISNSEGTDNKCTEGDIQVGTKVDEFCSSLTISMPPTKYPDETRRKMRNNGLLNDIQGCNPGGRGIERGGILNDIQSRHPVGRGDLMAAITARRISCNE